METQHNTHDNNGHRQDVAASVGNLAARANSGEATANIYEGLFDPIELKLLELLRDGTKSINLHRAAKITLDDSVNYRALLLRKFDLNTNPKNLDQLTYLAVVNGVVPVNVKRARRPVGVTKDEAATFKLVAEGLTTPEIAKELGRSRGAIKANRGTAIKKLNPNREPRGNAILAVKYGLVSVRPVEEQLAFAEEMRQRSLEQVALFESVRPVSIEQLTDKWRYKKIDGKRFRIRVMMTPLEYRNQKKAERAKQAAEAEQTEQAVTGVNVDRLIGSVGVETVYNEDEAIPDNF